MDTGSYASAVTVFLKLQTCLFVLYLISSILWKLKINWNNNHVKFSPALHRRKCNGRFQVAAFLLLFWVSIFSCQIKDLQTTKHLHVIQPGCVGKQWLFFPLLPLSRWEPFSSINLCVPAQDRQSREKSVFAAIIRRFGRTCPTRSPQRLQALHDGNCLRATNLFHCQTKTEQKVS